jgi:hypothetical protein
LLKNAGATAGKRCWNPAMWGDQGRRSAIMIDRAAL